MILPIDVTFNMQIRNARNEFNDEEIRKSIEKANEKQQKKQEKFTKNTKPLREGAKVMVKLIGMSKEEKFEGPYVVKECITRWKYRLKHVVTNVEKVRNFNQLKILKNATK